MHTAPATTRMRRSPWLPRSLQIGPTKARRSSSASAAAWIPPCCCTPSRHRRAVRARGLRAIHVHHGLQRRCRCMDRALRTRVRGARRPAGCCARGGRSRSRRWGWKRRRAQARHAAFAAELRDGELLALAHHRDDQAETFLLRALRASGPDGLGAMRALRPFGPGWLWRPLLDVPRAELLALCAGARPATGSRIPATPRRPRPQFPAPSRAAAAARTLAARRCRLRPLRGAERRSRRPARRRRRARAGDARVRRPGRARVDALRALAGRAPRARAAALDPRTRPAAVAGRRHRAASNPTCCRRARCRRRFAWAGAEHPPLARRCCTPTACALPLPADWHGTGTAACPWPCPTAATLALHRRAPASTPRCASARAGAANASRLPGRAHSHALKHVLQEPACRRGSASACRCCRCRRRRALAAGDLACSAAPSTPGCARTTRALHWTPASRRIDPAAAAPHTSPMARKPAYRSLPGRRFRDLARRSSSSWWRRWNTAK